jgi:hypothetical protein
MKKLFIAALIVVVTGTSAFAVDKNIANYKVKSSFEAQFSSAENVNWTAKENYIKASFTLQGQQVEAFYSPTDGELIGVTRKVEFNKLPLNAIQKIKKDYAGYKITDSIEFEGDTDRAYYVSLEEGDKKKILLVSLYGTVSVYKEARK